MKSRGCEVRAADFPLARRAERLYCSRCGIAVVYDWKFGDHGERAALDDIWRRLEHAGAQDIRNGRQASLIIIETLCIPRREFRDLPFRMAAADLQKASVAQRQEIRYRALDDPQSMHGKIRGRE